MAAVATPRQRPAFKTALKRNAKLRFAISGPAGSGKTYSLLSIATALDPGGTIAYIDTEHGSASKYADLFKFDVVEPDVFDPRELIAFIGDAADGGYSCICIDSLSHYWMGAGGELEMVDNVAKRSQSGNSFAAWKTVTPYHTALVDAIIGAPLHVLVSMRTKTEWVIEKDDRGKSVPRKVGLQPVMRDGIEFEFDVCGEIDQENTLSITKSRCPKLSGTVINRPGKPTADILRDWLSTGTEEPRPVVVAMPSPAITPKTDPMREAFDKIHAEIGDKAYFIFLGNNGYEKVEDIKDKAVAKRIWMEMESYRLSKPETKPQQASPQPAVKLAESMQVDESDLPDELWPDGRE